jgi:hypothetical protein
MTRSRAAQLGLAVLAAAGLASAALAHHGWSTYTIDDFTLEGEVKELRFGNPHDRLTVVAADGAEWDVWLSPPGRHPDFDQTKVNVGDTVIAYGNRHMDMGRNEMKTERLTVRSEAGEVVYDLYPNRLGS